MFFSVGSPRGSLALVSSALATRTAVAARSAAFLVAVAGLTACGGEPTVPGTKALPGPGADGAGGDGAANGSGANPGSGAGFGSQGGDDGFGNSLNGGSDTGLGGMESCDQIDSDFEMQNGNASNNAQALASVIGKTYPGNEDKFEGYELGGEELALKDSDGGLAFPVAGVLYGDADLDWYKFYGWDSKDAFSLVDPSVTLTVGDSSIKLALFVECAETDLKHLTCATDAVSVTDESGRDGCESTVSVALKLDEAAPLAAGSYNCDTTADSSYVWFRVRSESTEQCLPYQLEVHF